MDREPIMKQWDAWRKYIIDGDRASWPRDAFETLLDSFEKQQNNAVPSIDLLQARMERGAYLKQLNGKWWLFDKDGESITYGKRLRDILFNLIWMDC